MYKHFSTVKFRHYDNTRPFNPGHSQHFPHSQLQKAFHRSLLRAFLVLLLVFNRESAQLVYCLIVTNRSFPATLRAALFPTFQLLYSCANYKQLKHRTALRRAKKAPRQILCHSALSLGDACYRPGSSTSMVAPAGMLYIFCPTSSHSSVAVGL